MWSLKSIEEDNFVYARVTHGCRFDTQENSLTKEFTKNLLRIIVDFIHQFVKKFVPIKYFLYDLSFHSTSLNAIHKKDKENSAIGYFVEADSDYLKELFDFHKDLSFLPARKKVNKCEKLICSIEDKEKYVVYIVALKTNPKSWVNTKKGTQNN